MAKEKNEAPKQVDHGKRIDAIVAVLKANGLSLPKELE
jgi:hypothetical protein